MNKSDTLTELIKALNKCQSEIKGAIKDTKNAFFNNAKYADLASVWDAVREPMTKHGLAITQTTSFVELVNEHNLPIKRELILETTLFHISGEWISGAYPVKPMMQRKATPEAKAEWIDTDNPQAMGSCITYARRYALMAIIGIAPEDDDGNLATGHLTSSEQKAPKNGLSDSKSAIPVVVKQGITPPESKQEQFVVDLSGKPADWVGKKVFELIIQLRPGKPKDQCDLLEELSGFDGEEGHVKGKRDINSLSDKRLGVIYRKLQDMAPKKESKSFEDVITAFKMQLGDNVFFKTLGSEGIEDYKGLINPADQAKIIKLLELVAKDFEKKEPESIFK